MRSVNPCIGIFFCIFFASAQTVSNYDTLVHNGNTQLQAGNNDLALATAQSAIKLKADRWEAYALAGGALMNMKRYEEAADDFSKAIEHAPEAKQEGLRSLRKQCLLAESGVSPNSAVTSAQTAPPVSTTQAEIVLWKSIENSTNPEDFKTYLKSYPSGAFVPLAQRRLAELQQQLASARTEQVERERNSEIWTDPDTGLTWTRKDNHFDISGRQAADFCKNLSLADYSWRLPAIDELQGIFLKKKQHNDNYSVKGSLQLSVWRPDSNTASSSVLYLPVASHKAMAPDAEWSNSPGQKSGEAWVFDFRDGNRHSLSLDSSVGNRVLCVRKSTN